MTPITDEQVIKRFTSLNPTLSIVGTIPQRGNSDVTIHCSTCGSTFTKKRYSILRNYECGCAICKGKSVMKGVNDVATTVPWIVKYFKNKEDAYKYTKGSHKYVMTKCTSCGHEQLKIVKNMVTQGYHCPCCSINISFPNKISRGLLKNFPVKNWICEYAPDWAEGRAYDNYFEYKGKEYILEMDGGLGHGHSDFEHKKDIKGLEIDKWKDEMAKLHGIEVIRIDSVRSDFEYIKENILSSKLIDVFDFSNLDWNKVAEYAFSDLLKDICNYYSEGHISYKDIMSHFKVGRSVILKALKTGNELGLCEYSYAIAKKNAGKLNAVTQMQRDGVALKVFKKGEYMGTYNNIQNAARAMMKKFPNEVNQSGFWGGARKRQYYKDFTFELLS